MINKIMNSFTKWFEATTVTNPDLAAVTAAPGAVTAPAGAQPEKMTTKDVLNKYKIKPWKASKEEIVNFWNSLTAGQNIAVKPIPYDHEGSTIQEDGIRITGTKEFISSVLSRLKDFLPFENPNTKLMLAYRQNPRSFLPGSKNSYIFYIQVMERGKD
jgi:hypothetical protein